MTSGDHRSAAIVVGVDGTPCADLALRWAADTARRHVRPLQIVHVTDGGAERLTTGYQSPSGEATAGAGEVLAKAAAEVNRHNPGVAVTTRLVDDEPGRGLVAAAAGASMVVVGSWGHGGLHDLVLG